MMSKQEIRNALSRVQDYVEKLENTVSYKDDYKVLDDILTILTYINLVGKDREKIMREYMKGYDIGRKHGIATEMSHIKYIRQAIQFDLNEVENSLVDCENAETRAYMQGRIFAYNHILIIIDQMINENGEKANDK